MSEAEIVDFTRAVQQVIDKLDLNPGADGQGYRLISNAGASGMQEVPHMHMHILAGRPLGRLVDPA